MMVTGAAEADDPDGVGEVTVVTVPPFEEAIICQYMINFTELTFCAVLTSKLTQIITTVLCLIDW